MEINYKYAAACLLVFALAGCQGSGRDVAVEQLGGSFQQGLATGAINQTVFQGRTATSSSQSRFPILNGVDQSSQSGVFISVEVSDMDGQLAYQGEVNIPATATTTTISFSEVSDKVSGVDSYVSFSKEVTVGGIFAGGSLYFDATVDYTANDYLVGGIWLLVNSGGNDLILAAFVDGNDILTTKEQIMPYDASQAIAQYEGKASGFYSDTNMPENTAFNADVLLTVRFQSPSPVSGEEYRGDSAGVISSFRNSQGEILFDGDPVLKLGRISGSGSDLVRGQIDPGFIGFFGGETQLEAAGSPQYDGFWGARFYNQDVGKLPKSVAGTFGAKTGDSTKSILGVFTTHKQSEVVTPLP